MQNFLNGGGEQLKEFGWFRGPNEMFQDVDQITSNNITDQKTKAPTQRMPEPEPPADFRQQKQGKSQQKVMQQTSSEPRNPATTTPAVKATKNGIGTSHIRAGSWWLKMHKNAE